MGWYKAGLCCRIKYPAQKLIDQTIGVTEWARTAEQQRTNCKDGVLLPQKAHKKRQKRHGTPIKSIRSNREAQGQVSTGRPKQIWRTKRRSQNDDTDIGAAKRSFKISFVLVLFACQRGWYPTIFYYTLLKNRWSWRHWHTKRREENGFGTVLKTAASLPCGRNWKIRRIRGTPVSCTQPKFIAHNPDLTPRNSERRRKRRGRGVCNARSIRSHKRWEQGDLTGSRGQPHDLRFSFPFLIVLPPLPLPRASKSASPSTTSLNSSTPFKRKERKCRAQTVVLKKFAFCSRAWQIENCSAYVAVQSEQRRCISAAKNGTCGSQFEWAQGNKLTLYHKWKRPTELQRRLSSKQRVSHSNFW